MFATNHKPCEPGVGQGGTVEMVSAASGGSMANFPSAFPAGVAVNPKGTTLYIADFEGGVSAVSLGPDFGGTIESTSTKNFGLGVTPNSAHVYASDNGVAIKP